MSDTDFDRLERIFADAVDLDTEERTGFLDGACGGDAMLRAQLESMLDDHVRADGFMRVPNSAPAEEPGAALVGQRIGRYRIDRVIASGGMGTVYVATQDEPQREVALKVMKRGIASRSALRRFQFEAQVLGRLRHPNIAQVYEAGTHDDGGGGAPWFAMEYIADARPITAYAEARELGTRDRLAMFAKVCQAVHHGHQKGVIHRDLKPSNILVDAAGEPKIIDFGVARATDSDIAITTMQTDVGQLVGTLQYMSPEQVEADPNDLDVRSDVYSLGVVLYELLCDGLPYEVSGARVFEATRIIREQSPTRPSSIDRALRGDLETIVLQALEKDRDRRYQSAAELAADLRRYLASEPITARPASAMYQLRVFARRNKAVVGGLAATFVAIVAGLIGIAAVNVRLEQRNVELERIAYASEIRSIEELWRTGLFAGLDERLEALPTEYRGLEWDLLRHRVEPIAAREIRFDDDSRITVLEASPDGSRFLVGSRSGVARIYDATTWQIQRELPTQTDRLRDGDFDPAGQRIILSLETLGLVMFDARTGRELARPPDTPSFRAEFSPDGKRIASVDGGGRISILDSDDLTVLGEFESPGAVVNRIEYSPDGQHLLTACNDGWVRLVDATAGTVVDELLHSDDRKRVRAARFSVDGRRIVTGGRGGRVLGWSCTDATSGDEIVVSFLQEYQSHQQHIDTDWLVNDVDFSADGRSMASCGGDGIVRIHNLANGAVDCQLKASFPQDTPFELTRVRFDAAGTGVVAAGANGIIHTWSLDGVGMPLELIGHGWGIYETCASPDGAFAFSAGGEGTLRKWDLLTGEQVYARHVSTYQAYSVDLTPDGSLVVVGTLDGHGSILDAASGEVLRNFEMPRGTGAWTTDGAPVGLMCVRVSPDGRTIAAGVGTWLKARDWKRKTPIHIFDLQTGRLIDTRDGHHASVTGVAYTADSRTLFSVGLDGRLLRWDLRSADPPVVVATRPHQSNDVLVNEHAGEVIWGLSTGQVLAHDVETGEERWSFQACDATVSSLDLSPDGTRLLTSGLFLAGVSLWDMTTRKRLLTLAEDMERSWSAGFAGQDRIIVGEGMDGGRYFGTPTGELRCFEAVPAGERLGSRLSARQEQARHRDRWLELERTVQRAIEARDAGDVSEMDRLLREVVTSLNASPLHEPVFEAWLRQRVGREYPGRDHDDEKIRQHEVVAEICERRGRAGTRMLAETLRSICSCLIRKGELAEARECCGRLLSLSREELGGPEPQDVRLMRDLGDAYLDADDTANAVPLLEQSLELHREMYGEKSARTAHALQSIVRLYADTNRLDAAIDAATRMLEIRRDVVGELHRNTLWSMRRLAQLFNQAGRYAEAADLRAELYVARCQVQGADHPQALEVLANMAGDELLAGDRERGERLAREALEAVLAKEPDPGLFTALNNAAWFVVVYPYLTADLYLMAHEAAQRAVRLGNLKVSLNTLGTAQYRVGEFEKALQTLRRSDELLADTTGRYPGNWAFMAMAHHQLGETEKAANAMSRLRELMQESAHANDHECQLFLRETETLIESPRTDRTPSPP